MLCGLLPARMANCAWLAQTWRHARADARAHWWATLSEILSVRRAMWKPGLIESAYGLRGPKKRPHSLGPSINSSIGRTPRAQRSFPAASSNARHGRRAAHEPEILFSLSRPAAADPARAAGVLATYHRAAEQGLCDHVTTHFMQEAEYCDRIAIMDAGRVLAEGGRRDSALADTHAGAEPSNGGCVYRVVERSRRQKRDE